MELWLFISLLGIGGFISYLLCCRDVSKIGIGQIICEVMPTKCGKFVRKYIGNWLPNCLAKMGNYTFQQRNPLVQIIYIFISFFGFYMFYINGLNKHLPNIYSDYYHKYTGTSIALLAFASFIHLCMSQPGIVTKDNIKKLNPLYPNDDKIWPKGECALCKIPKIGRMHHCKLCGICVERYDHHCIWFNRCIGKKNYKFFVFFLFIHSIFCAYVAILGGGMIIYIIKAENLFGQKYTY